MWELLAAVINTSGSSSGIDWNSLIPAVIASLITGAAAIIGALISRQRRQKASAISARRPAAPRTAPSVTRRLNSLEEFRDYMEPIIEEILREMDWRPPPKKKGEGGGEGE